MVQLAALKLIFGEVQTLYGLELGECREEVVDGDLSRVAKDRTSCELFYFRKLLEALAKLRKRVAIKWRL